MKHETTTPDRSTLRLGLAVAGILTVPMLAMLVTDEVAWGPLDFLVAGALLFGTGFAYQLASRRASEFEYRAGAVLALAAAFLLVWMNLAVGIIGDEGNPANAMYIGVLVVGLGGAIVARFQARGLSLAVGGAALAVAIVAAIALVFRLGEPANGPLQMAALHGFFVMLFALSALLFRQAAQSGEERAATGR
jgi:hypothetical protein